MEGRKQGKKSVQQVPLHLLFDDLFLVQTLLDRSLMFHEQGKDGWRKVHIAPTMKLDISKIVPTMEK